MERNVWGESVVALDDSDKAALSVALAHVPSGHRDFQRARELLAKLGARE